MRRQYHSRLVDGKTLVWDVHRLSELSRGTPVKTIPLSSIRELDEAFWFTETIPSCRVVAEHARLIGETDLRYPIILSADGRVMDGMHRVCKALLEQRATFFAVQFETDPAPDHTDVDLDSLPYGEPW
jgi:hypothetical protein